MDQWRVDNSDVTQFFSKKFYMTSRMTVMKTHTS